MLLTHVTSCKADIKGDICIAHTHADMEKDSSASSIIIWSLTLKRDKLILPSYFFVRWLLFGGVRENENWKGIVATHDFLWVLISLFLFPWIRVKSLSSTPKIKKAQQRKWRVSFDTFLFLTNISYTSCWRIFLNVAVLTNSLHT